MQAHLSLANFISAHCVSLYNALSYIPPDLDCRTHHQSADRRPHQAEWVAGNGAASKHQILEHCLTQRVAECAA